MKPPRHPWLLTTTAVVITAAFLLPVYWMVKTSLTPPDRVLAPTPQWVPAPVTGENYATALGSAGTQQGPDQQSGDLQRSRWR